MNISYDKLCDILSISTVCVCVLLEYPAVGDGSMTAKEACYSLSTLLLELARIDANTTTIRFVCVVCDILLC